MDEATVSIENIHTQLLPGVSRARAVLESSRQTALARLLSMLCILAVFVPSFFMTGVSRQLFVPLSDLGLCRIWSDEKDYSKACRQPLNPPGRD